MHEYKPDNISEGPDRAGLCESHKFLIADAFATSLAESYNTCGGFPGRRPESASSNYLQAGNRFPGPVGRIEQLCLNRPIQGC
jgi:hypothetical protein